MAATCAHLLSSPNLLLLFNTAQLIIFAVILHSVYKVLNTWAHKSLSVVYVSIANALQTKQENRSIAKMNDVRMQDRPAISQI